MSYRGLCEGASMETVSKIPPFFPYLLREAYLPTIASLPAGIQSKCFRTTYQAQGVQFSLPPHLKASCEGGGRSTENWSRLRGWRDLNLSLSRQPASLYHHGNYTAIQRETVHMMRRRWFRGEWGMRDSWQYAVPPMCRATMALQIERHFRFCVFNG